MIGDGRTDGLVRRAPRWVLRATLGKSSDRGEPECFRPARTLREAIERRRLLLGEPDAALPLGPRIGQRLGARPVTGRFAGAVPAPHEAPSPFASSNG